MGEQGASRQGEKAAGEAAGGKPDPLPAVAAGPLKVPHPIAHRDATPNREAHGQGNQGQGGSGKIVGVLDHLNTYSPAIQAVSGVGALFAAILAVIWAKRAAEAATNNLKAFVSASKPQVVITLADFHGPNDLIGFHIVCTNVGGTGCVLTTTADVWCKKDDVPDVVLSDSIGAALPPGASHKALRTVSKRQLIEAPYIEGFVAIEGAFLEGRHLERFRFEVFPAMSAPYSTWYRRLDPLAPTASGRRLSLTVFDRGGSRGQE